MRDSFFIRRIFTVLLTLILALPPPPAHALRSGIEGKARAGLEEELRPAAPARRDAAAGMEEESRPRIRLGPAFQQLPAPLRAFIKRLVIPVFLGFGEMSEPEMARFARWGVSLRHEMMGSDLFSPGEKRALDGFMEAAAQGIPVEELRRLNLEVLIPRGVCLDVSGSGIRLFRVAGYELYEVPGIKTPLPIILTPDLGRRKAQASPVGIAAISIRGSPGFIKHASDEELRHIVDLCRFGIFHEIVSLDDLDQAFRFRSSATLPAFLRRLPDHCLKRPMAIVAEARARLWHLYHPRPYQKRDRIDVSLLLRDPEKFQIVDFLRRVMEGEQQAIRIIQESEEVNEYDVAVGWVAARILSLKPEGPYELSEIRPLARRIWEQEFSPSGDPIQHLARRIYPKTEAEREAQILRLAQQAGGMEEGAGAEESRNSRIYRESYEKIERYLRTRPGGPITIDDIARGTGLGPRTVRTHNYRKMIARENKNRPKDAKLLMLRPGQRPSAFQTERKILDFLRRHPGGLVTLGEISRGTGLALSVVSDHDYRRLAVRVNRGRSQGARLKTLRAGQNMAPVQADRKILDFLRRHPGGLVAPGEIARGTGLNPATVRSHDYRGLIARVNKERPPDEKLSAAPPRPAAGISMDERMEAMDRRLQQDEPVQMSEVRGLLRKYFREIFKTTGTEVFNDLLQAAMEIAPDDPRTFWSLVFPVLKEAERLPGPAVEGFIVRRIRQLNQPTAGLEEGKGLPKLLERVRAELPAAGQQERPLRFIVDTSRGEPRVLRLLQSAVLLEKEKGLRVQAAGVATAEELTAVLDRLPDETSRLLLESRVFKYIPGDPESYQKAMENARKLVPGLHPEAVIAGINRLTVGWFLETIEILGIWKLSSQFKKQMDSVLTAA